MNIQQNGQGGVPYYYNAPTDPQQQQQQQQPQQQQQYQYNNNNYDSGNYNYDSSNYYYDYTDENDEEEMPATERELADDAQWKLIQKNTFTRWANEHLKLVNKNVSDLEYDLSDGLRFLSLIEVLSGKKFQKYNRRPNFRTQKLENVTMCLKFLEVDEGIKIVNIDSTDIVDHKLKLILGLIWTLILHYSISMPMWDGDDYDPSKPDKTPKQKLLGWIQSKLPDKPIQNFTTDWNDGTAIGALVDAVAPGLCPDWQDWTPENAIPNATEAMNAAEQWLDVPQLIRPAEMCNPKVDELSMMTYLSQYPNAKLKHGAPLKPKTNPARIKAYGPGIEPYGNTAGNPARFIVETFAAGSGEPEIVVVNPNGQQEPCEVIFNNDRSASYNCVYVPSMAGPYRVHVKFAGKETPKSPYVVNVEAVPGDAGRVTASGPGIEKTGVVANRKTYFEVHTKNVGVGVVDVGIVDPTGRRDIVKPLVARKSDDNWYVEYLPLIEGLHSVNVYFAGKSIPMSPYPVHVSREGAPPVDANRIPPGKQCAPLDAARSSIASPTAKPSGLPVAPVEPVTKQQPQGVSQMKKPPADARRCYATGRGIQPKGVRVGDDADFKVHTQGAGDGDLMVRVLGPGGVEERIRVRKLDPVTFECAYTPRKPGLHTVVINYGGQPITKSPFKVDVGPLKQSHIRAFGPGLETGVVGFPACFTVETNGETGALGFSIEGPSQAKIDCKDNGDGSADITYWPTAPGEYAVHILCNEEDIPKSPYMADIRPMTGSFDPSKVEASGPGLQRVGNTVNKWAEFTVDTRRAGRAPLTIVAMDADYNPVDVLVQDNKDGTFFCRYMPKRSVKHTILISYGGVSIPHSPYRVLVQESSNPSKVKVYGPALERPVKTFQRTFLIVDCTEAGPGDVAIGLADAKGMDCPVETRDNGDNTFRIDFEPTTVGMYTANVFFADQEIPASPYKIKVEPSIDVGKVKVEGLEERVPVGKEVDFDIITTGAGKGQVQVLITSPSGKLMAAKIEETIDGFGAKFVPIEIGPHSVQVVFAGQPVPKSPFRCVAYIDEQKPAPPPKGDPMKVKAYGPGLTTGKANAPADFTIDTREAGPGGLGLTIEGPCEAKIECFDRGDGTCDVRYWPTEPGDYVINITYDEKPIAKSPFKALIQPSRTVDVSNVRAYGPGLQPTGVFLDSTTDFIVDATQVIPKGQGKVKAFVTSPNGLKTEALTNNNNDGTFKCLYTPFEQGLHLIDVTYDGFHIPRSPFKVNVVPGCDPSKVRAYGPGLEGGHTNQPQIFTVETRGAGQGGLGLAIEGPSEAKMNCRDNRDGSCTVEYLPTKAGDYDISVKFANRDIPGSAFHVHITDEVNPMKVRCYGPGIEPKGVRRGQPGLFTVDTTNAGIAPLEVFTTDSKGRKRPAQINRHGDETFDVVYYPDTEGPLTVDVNYAGKPVPGSPFHTRIWPSFDASRVIVSGDGVKPTGVLASIPTTFLIDTRDAGLADLDVVIQDPYGNFVRSKIMDNNDGTYVVTYTPSDVGRYMVDVKFGGQNVPHAPFYVNTSPTGDASKVKILDGVRTTIPVGEECVININTADAGYGNITCHIRSTSGSDVDIDIVDNADGTVSVLYTPRLPGAYTINLKFGGQPIPSGNFTQQAMDPEKLKAMEKPTFNPVDFCIPIGPIFSFVSATVTTPSGEQHRPVIEDNKNGTVKIKYSPRETGLHKLDVLYNNNPIDGSPFNFFVHALGRGVVTAYGPGLSHGLVGQPCPFTIVTKDAGTGGLALAVEGPSKAEITCVDNKDGTCSVSYLPTAPGEYNIIIQFADQHIPGSPFTAKIVGDNYKQAYLSVGTSSEVSLRIMEADISNLTASIRSPSGYEEPCLLKRLPNGHLGISFTPREVGYYLVNVYRPGKQHIPNSPFKIYVGETEVGNASKVKVYGRGLTRGMANELNEFFVNTKDAGYGGLSLSVEGPSKADIDCQDNDDGSCRVTYRPTEPGDYLVNVKFADEHVPGSPYMVRIDGEPSGRMTEKILRQREAADITHIGSECELSLKIPGTNKYDMEASVSSPSGYTETCHIQDLGSSHYSIKFVPKEMGVHTVSVKHRGVHIPGSPFQFTVGPITDGGAHKVRAIGHGLDRGEVHKQNHFSIYTREAGAGGLSIAVEGPSKAEIDFQDKKDGSCDVAYVCTEPGDYLVSIKFNDQHIPDSPFKVHVTSPYGDVRKLNVIDIHQQEWQINKPAAFTVDFNGAQGRLDARVVAPSGEEDQAIIQEIEKDRYAVRFTPRENGVHLIHVRLNGNHIPGSPFRVFVGKQEADPGLVRAYGDGLHHGSTGQLCKFIVNTVNAGSGALAVTVDGPSKVQLTCREVEEGYEFTYTPLAPGDYLITIKYGGNYHIPGSPFRARIEGPGRPAAWSEQSQVVVETITKTSTTQKLTSGHPHLPSDPTKVKVTGVGLQRAYANKETYFTVDTTEAGYNMLMVGVMGPEIPCEEVKVKHVGDCLYNVAYTVHQPGNYVLVVKWGEQHIPGSPFHISVLP